ncbi:MULTISPECIES: PQQ-like beta-propeller repeat protein [Prauserella salsuginis group]|uniref:PQQ-like beta-propeller repeat protein n=1 Tax=Prauserella salsuginis TaxID=387889 RepID=A0ABW6FZD0_9PSEU|nr:MULTISPECIES: PQQ-like beta-propeller repeat protein [Prauserella salsuginis group]MCR3721028.1 PQQ-like domain-containing protein [Prauserella flava]MCR3734891.1 PQQ-like domain-containing protein [Prauserella salsuginis]
MAADEPTSPDDPDSRAPDGRAPDAHDADAHGAAVHGADAQGPGTPDIDGRDHTPDADTGDSDVREDADASDATAQDRRAGSYLITLLVTVQLALMVPAALFTTWVLGGFDAEEIQVWALLATGFTALGLFGLWGAGHAESHTALHWFAGLAALFAVGTAATAVVGLLPTDEWQGPAPLYALLAAPLWAAVAAATWWEMRLHGPRATGWAAGGLITGSCVVIVTAMVFVLGGFGPALSDRYLLWRHSDVESGPGRIETPQPSTFDGSVRWTFEVGSLGLVRDVVPTRHGIAVAYEDRGFPRVALLSARDGEPVWMRSLEEGRRPRIIAADATHVVVRWNTHGTDVDGTVLDTRTGASTSVWNYGGDDHPLHAEDDEPWPTGDDDVRAPYTLVTRGDRPDGRLAAVDIDGAELWDRRVDCINEHVEAAHDDVALLGCDGDTLAFDARTGSRLWEASEDDDTLESNVASTVTGRLYITAGSETGRITARRLSDGADAWSTGPPPEGTPCAQSAEKDWATERTLRLTAGADTLYVSGCGSASDSDVLTAMPFGGSPAWHHRYERRTVTDVLPLSGERALVASADRDGGCAVDLVSGSGSTRLADSESDSRIDCSYGGRLVRSGGAYYLYDARGTVTAIG